MLHYLFSLEDVPRLYRQTLLLGENSCKLTVLSISLNWSYSQIDKNIYNTLTAY